MVRIIVLFLVSFAVFIGGYTSSQYFYFTDMGNGYQQGCEEDYKIKFKAGATTGAKGGILRLQLDETMLEYSHDITGTLFSTTSVPWPDWVAGDNNWNSNYDDVIISRYKKSAPDALVYGDNEFAHINFKPRYKATAGYTSDFIIDYRGDTVNTALSNNVNIILPGDQNTRLTGTISVDREPCFPDGSGPVITISGYTDGAYHETNVGLDVFFNDGGSSALTTTPYARTGGYNIGDWTGNTWFATNANGVDDATISISVNGNTNSALFDDPSELNIVHTLTTWKDETNNTRGITGLDSNLFGIEKTITIVATGADRVGYTTDKMISFNDPVAPVVSNKEPTGSYNNLDVQVSFDINDAWAGVDTGTVVVSLSGISPSASGFIYTEYSGNQLIFSGITQTLPRDVSGNGGGYHVYIDSHVDFPETGNIQVIVKGQDLENYPSNSVPTSNSRSFWTRPSCDSLACCDPITLQTGYNAAIRTGLYNNNDLYVSGGNNAILNYNAGDATGYIDCGLTNNGLSVYSGHGDNTGSSSYIDFQEGNSLFFSGTNIKVVRTGINNDTFILYRFGNFTIKAYPSNRQSGKWGNDGKLFFYANGNRTTPLFSGFVNTNVLATGTYIQDIPTGLYDIVYKGQGQLGSYLSGIQLTGGETKLLDFTTGPDLYITKTEGSDETGIAGDIVRDGKVNVMDIGAVADSGCNYNTSVNQYYRCNLNGDGSVNIGDVTVVANNAGQTGPFFITTPIFGGFSR